jgi:ribosomal protein S18 acetylase RimI-like enzyme
VAVELRRFEPADAGEVWALSRIPNIGRTADPSAPLPLAPLREPPAEFPGLADIGRTFIDAHGEFVVGREEGALVAMGGVWPTGERQAEVKHVRVHPAVRRRGIGRALMSAVEDAASALGYERLHLDTASNQPEAVAFYRSLGYEEVGRETRPEWTWTLVYFAKQLR